MIHPASLADLDLVTDLALLLWPENERGMLQAELGSLLRSPETRIMLDLEDGVPVGFAQCQLRHDYVEGTDHSPVGYLEGVFVREEFRRRGIARAMLEACEQWAREVGCTEFASDCELGNEASLRFHRRVGFAEANRIICFVKPL